MDLAHTFHKANFHLRRESQIVPTFVEDPEVWPTFAQSESGSCLLVLDMPERKYLAEDLVKNSTELTTSVCLPSDSGNGCLPYSSDNTGVSEDVSGFGVWYGERLANFAR